MPQFYGFYDPEQKCRTYFLRYIYLTATGNGGKWVGSILYTLPGMGAHHFAIASTKWVGIIVQ
jgi:hypothetical protein